MRILIVTPSYKPATVYGGPTMSVSQLAEQLSLGGHWVTVYTTTANGKSELPVLANAEINVESVPVFYFTRITKDHTHFSPRLLWTLWRHVKDFDVVHIHSWWTMVSVLSALLCLIRGVRPVVSPRGMLSGFSFDHKNSGYKLWLHRLLGKRLLKHSVIHATAQQEFNEIQTLAPGMHGFVLPNFVTLGESAIAAEVKPTSSVFTIGFLSRIDSKKGIELLLEALARIKFPFQLLIAGQGDAAYVQKLKDQGETLGLTHSIHWVGWLEGDAKFRFLHQLDLFVLTSINENFANVVVEALSVGTPVLVSDGVGLSSFVRQHDLGWVASQQVDSLVEQLNQAFADESRRLKIQRHARQIVAESFTGESLCRQYVNEYKKLIQ